MLFPSPLRAGRLVRRYKRFLADVQMDDGPPDAPPETVHVPNSGAMLGLTDPGSRVWISTSQNPNRKLPCTLELVEEAATGTLVGTNTGHPNRLVEEAIRAGFEPSLTGYADLRREVRYGGNSRVDLLLTDPIRGLAYVEVKNVHLRRRGTLAEFPDCVTTRGAKHLEELGAMVRAGHRAVMVFLVQRGDCTHFAPAKDIDPAYAAGLIRAVAVGVEAYCWACHVTPDGIHVVRSLGLSLDGEQAAAA